MERQQLQHVITSTWYKVIIPYTMHGFIIQSLSWELKYKTYNQFNLKATFIQEAQWACITHLVFAIYIPLSIYDHRCYTPDINTFIQTSDSWKKDVSSFLLYNRIWKFVPFNGMVIYEQTWISLPQGYPMPNINAFRPVVHEKKIFEDLSKFSIFCPLLGPKRGQPLFEQIWIPIPQGCFLPSLVEIGLVVLEKKIF